LAKPLVSARAEKALRDIGLTEYESMAYLALVRAGELTAGQISENTTIPYSKVYSVLDSLDKKGWVEVKGGRPRQYYPKSPVEALGAERLRMENLFDGYREILVGELQPLYERREIKEKPEIWIIRGQENIGSKMREALNDVKRELLVALPEIDPQRFEAIFPFLEQMRDKKIRINLLTTEEAVSSMESYLVHMAEVRVREEMFGGGLVVDGQETFLFLSEGNSEKKYLAIWSDHIGLTMVSRGYFEYLWNTAKPYSPN